MCCQLVGQSVSAYVRCLLQFNNRFFCIGSFGLKETRQSSINTSISAKDELGSTDPATMNIKQYKEHR